MGHFLVHSTVYEYTKLAKGRGTNSFPRGVQPCTPLYPALVTVTLVCWWLDLFKLSIACLKRELRDWYELRHSPIHVLTELKIKVNQSDSRILTDIVYTRLSWYKQCLNNKLVLHKFK
jgi:hypothetical protein